MKAKIRVEKLGEGKPEYSIVTGLHGDEPSGKKAFERLKRKGLPNETTVKLVVANEKALNQGERYLDKDLNRSFPGDPNSNIHEEKLASEIIEEIEGTKTLDIHGTHSEPVPHGVLVNPTEAEIKMAKSTGVEKFIVFPEPKGAMIDISDSIAVECGPQGTDEAVEMIDDIIEKFLRSSQVNQEDSRTEFYEFKGEEKGVGFEFLKKNFQKVEKGEIYARKGENVRRAEEEFYPILMSTDGYEDKIGFRARKIKSIYDWIN